MIHFSVKRWRRSRVELALQPVLKALADPTTRGWYVSFCMVIMVLPMALLSYWYHSKIKNTEGGRKLMKREALTTTRNFAEAARMAGDIARGKYGDKAQGMQIRVYWLAGVWLVANITAFGILLWADEVNRMPI